MDCSLPGSFVHGLLQTGILEWVAISFSKQASLSTYCVPGTVSTRIRRETNQTSPGSGSACSPVGKTDEKIHK